MATAGASARVLLKKILYLTDFSQPSEAALPFVVSIARSYGSVVSALYVLMPPPLVYSTPELREEAVSADEEFAEVEMQKVDSQLTGVAHETCVERGSEVWTTVEKAIKDSHADLLVLGTHGRTGIQKLLLGSVAEEVFRRSPVPVLTIGPAVFCGAHSEGEFRRVLFATDFGPETQGAARYAISFAQESQARLVLLHVIHGRQPGNGNSRAASVAEVMHRLHELVPGEAELWCRPETVAEYGDPAQTILRTAKDRSADLIVLGIHAGGRGVTQKTHLECAIAHKVVAHSPCPVLTARSEGRK